MAPFGVAVLLINQVVLVISSLNSIDISINNLNDGLNGGCDHVVVLVAW